MAPHTAITTNADYMRLPRYRYVSELVNYERVLPDMVRAVPFGDGFIDYAAFFAGLVEGGFDGLANYEMCSPIRGGGEPGKSRQLRPRLSGVDAAAHPRSRAAQNRPIAVNTRWPNAAAIAKAHAPASIINGVMRRPRGFWLGIGALSRPGTRWESTDMRYAGVWLLAMLAGAPSLAAADAVDYVRDVKPILRQALL